MLFGGGGPSEPAVIRNIDEELRAACGEPAHFAGIGGFIADKNTEGVAMRKRPHHVLVAFVEAAHFAGHACHYAMNQRKRFAFPERNEMNFVVSDYALALRVKTYCTVIRQKTALRRNCRGVH